MKKHHRIALLAMPLALGLVSGVSADTTLAYEGKGVTGHIYLSPNALRMDFPDASIIYDSQRNELISLMPRERKYVVMTEKDMQAIGDMQKQMMQQMEAQLASLPPEQREQMRQMMGGMVQTADSQPVVRYVNSGKKDTVLGKTCDIHVLQVDGKTRSRICLAMAESLDVPAADYAGFHRMMAFMRQMDHSAGADAKSLLPDLPEATLPLWFEDDNQRFYLKAVSHQSLGKSLFLPPPEYKRQATGLEQLRR